MPSIYFIIISFIAGISALAEPSAPAVKGRIVDPANAPVAGAKVAVQRVGAGVEEVSVSGPRGEFSVMGGEAAYRVRVAVEGFRETVYEVAAGGDANRTIEVQLQLEIHKDALVVSEAGVSLETDV